MVLMNLDLVLYTIKSIFVTMSIERYGPCKNLSSSPIRKRHALIVDCLTDMSVRERERSIEGSMEREIDGERDRRRERSTERKRSKKEIERERSREKDR